MLGHNLVLAVLNGGPVELAGIHAFDAEFFGVLEVIPKFGVEQQSFCGNATDVKTSSAEESVFFNERGFQAVLAGADGAGVSSGTAADECDVVDSFWQGLPLQKR